MAAVGQGQASGDGGQQGEGQAQQGQDLGQLTGQLEQLGTSLEEMRGFLQSQPWQQQEAQEGQEQQDEPFDLSFLDDPTIDQQTASQRLNDVLAGVVDQRAQQLMAPLAEQQTQMRRDQAARDLAGEFPELAEPEMAQLVAGRGGLAEQAAIQLGQPALAAEPSFWRLAYMAHKAAEAANQEGSGDPGAASLESGSGAGPAQMTEDDYVKAIAQAGGLGGRVLDGM
jgi:hypothetical protein